MINKKEGIILANTQDKSYFNQKLIAPMILGSILNPINSSIISVALIPIGKAFGVSPSQTAWLISALYVATAIGQPVVGKLIDLYGPRLLFLIATSLVGLSSFIAIFTPDFWWLVVARVLLGLGTCAGYPASMYLIRSEAERTGKDSPAKILTSLAIANQTIAVIGLTLGGLLIGLGGWQSIFIVNIPLSLACMILGYTRFPKASSIPFGLEKRNISIDITGIFFFGMTLISTLLFLMSPSLNSSYLILISIITGILFIIIELRSKDPFIDVRVFKGNSPLLFTYARSLLTATLTYCMLYGLPQWLEKGRGFSPSQTGLVLMPMFLMSIVLSKLTGKSPFIRSKLIVGGIIQLLAFLLLLFINKDSSLAFLLVIVSLLGIPQGLLNLANQNAVYFQANKSQIGASSGLLRTFMYMGAMLASAGNGLFLKSDSITTGMHQIAIFGAGIGIVLLIITLVGLKGVQEEKRVVGIK